MNDYQLVREIAAKLSIPVGYHVGSPGCKKCNGTGFVNISFWRKMWVHYINRLPWNCIRKDVWCSRCKGDLIWVWPKNKRGKEKE